MYVVAVMGVTGARGDLKTSTVDLIKRVRNHTDLPLSVGFGISKPEHVTNVIRAGADGAIVASAILDIITENLQDKEIMKRKIAEFCQKLKEATKKNRLRF